MLTATESNFKRSDFQSHLSLCDSDASATLGVGPPAVNLNCSRPVFNDRLTASINWLFLPQFEHWQLFSPSSSHLCLLTSKGYSLVTETRSVSERVALIPPVTPAGGIESGPHAAYHHVSDLYIYVLDLNSCNWPTSILPPSSFLSISQEGKR